MRFLLLVSVVIVALQVAVYRLALTAVHQALAVTFGALWVAIAVWCVIELVGA